MHQSVLEIQVRRPEEILALRLGDLPYGGLFVLTDQPLEAADPVLVSVRVDDQTPVRLEGAVLWTRSPDETAPHRPGGVAVGFFARSEAAFQDLLGRCQGQVVHLADRRARRYPTALKARVGGRPDLDTSVVSNLSLSGMFVRSRVPLQVGTEARFEVALPTEVLTLWGEVMWRRDEDDRETIGLGIRFLWRDHAARERLHGYLSGLAGAGGGASSGSSTSSRSLLCL